MESILDLSSKTINEILEQARIFKHRSKKNDFYSGSTYKNIIVGLLFFEPSTRTCMSFESAIHRLGLKIIKYNPENSSEQKGETLKDTIKIIHHYVDIFIIRHCEKNILSKIARSAEEIKSSREDFLPLQCVCFIAIINF